MPLLSTVTLLIARETKKQKRTIHLIETMLQHSRYVTNYNEISEFIKFSKKKEIKPLDIVTVTTFIVRSVRTVAMENSRREQI